MKEVAQEREAFAAYGRNDVEVWETHLKAQWEEDAALKERDKLFLKVYDTLLQVPALAAQPEEDLTLLAMCRFEHLTPVEQERLRSRGEVKRLSSRKSHFTLSRKKTKNYQSNSGFRLFATKMKQLNQASFAELSSAVVDKLVLAEWKALPTEEKLMFYRQATDGPR